MTTTAQVAALASLDDVGEIARRRDLNAAGPRSSSAAILERHGLEPAAGAVGNFLYVDLGEDAAPLFERLLRQGVIVRPLAGFGAPERDPHLGRHARRARVPRRGARPRCPSESALLCHRVELGDVRRDPPLERFVARRLLDA